MPWNKETKPNLTCTCISFHPGQVEPASSRANTAFQTVAAHVLQSWARSHQMVGQSWFHHKRPITWGPDSAARSSLIVLAQVCSCPPTHFCRLGKEGREVHHGCVCVYLHTKTSVTNLYLFLIHLCVCFLFCFFFVLVFLFIFFFFQFQEGSGHQGVKASKSVFLGDTNRIFTTGFSKLSERQYAIWDVVNIHLHYFHHLRVV